VTSRGHWRDQSVSLLTLSTNGCRSCAVNKGMAREIMIVTFRSRRVGVHVEAFFTWNAWTKRVLKGWCLSVVTFGVWTTEFQLNFKGEDGAAKAYHCGSNISVLNTKTSLYCVKLKSKCANLINNCSSQYCEACLTWGKYFNETCSYFFKYFSV
jgi:hypothetical protein